MSPRAWRGALAVVVALEVAAGVYVYTRHAAVENAAAPGRRVSAGMASAPTPADAGDPAAESLPAVRIPDRLPDFSLPDPAGKTTSIATWRDRALIINFWATWCAPCRHEIPLLETLERDWRSRGMEVVGIAVDRPDSVRTYAQELKIGYPLLVGEQSALDVAAALGFESPVFPFTVFTDRRGEVVTLFVGELHPAQADLILSVVERLNEGGLPLPDARRRIADGLQALAPPPAG